MTSNAWRRLLLGIQIICAAVVVGIAYHYYRPRQVIATALGIAIVFGAVSLKHSTTQRIKLADENIQKAGLTPDRDEAPPSV
jgi:hypothetical protein